MALGRMGDRNIFRQIAQRDVEDGEDFIHTLAIKQRQRIQTINAGKHALGFYFGKTAGGNRVFLIVIFFCNDGARRLHVFQRQTKGLAYCSQLLTGYHGAQNLCSFDPELRKS